MSDDDGFLSVCAAGAFGGIAPHLLRLFERFDSDPTLGLEAFLGEMIPMTILAAVGCGFVIVQKERLMRKAFFLGVSAPALILNAAPLLDADAPGPGLMLTPPWAVQSLYAASQESAPSEDASQAARSEADDKARSLTVQANLPVTGGIYIRDSSSSKEHKLAMDADGSWAVPTSEFRVVYRGMIGGQVPIQTPSAVVRSGSEAVVLRIHIGQTFLGGVLDGFGFDNLARQHVRADAKPEVASR